MAEQDGGRVEARTVLVGKGMGATPERIAELQQRANQLDKLTRPKPAQEFAAVLAKGSGGAGTGKPIDPKQQRLSQLPKKGPRPALLHPRQREAYAHDEGENAPVVLKG